MTQLLNLQDPEIRKKIRSALGEASASLTRIEAERDLIKEIVKALAEDHQLSKKALNKMVRVYHKQSFAKEVEESDEFLTMYETVTGESGKFGE